MKVFFKLSLFSLLFLVLSFTSASACYTERQLEAEQGLRIHSELMVIGLTCKKMPNGDGIYRKYHAFSRVYRSLLSEYEAVLIQYFISEGAADPEKEFHTLRTNIANKISQKAVSMSILPFCQKFSSRIDDALMMDEKKLRRWARKIWPNQPTSEQLCWQ